MSQPIQHESTYVEGMQAAQPVRLGRKRALPSCPNPMFLRWLTELRDEAREKGQKSQHTYHKVPDGGVCLG